MTEALTIDFDNPPFPTPRDTHIEASVFGSVASVDIRDFKPLTGNDDDMRIEFSLPSWSGRQNKANALEGIANLRLLLDAVEAVLRADEPAETWNVDFEFPLTPTESAVITGSTTPDGEAGE